MPDQIPTATNRTSPGRFRTEYGAELSQDEIEFATAMDHYKRVNRRPFPTWSEVLKVLESIGWRRVDEIPRHGTTGAREE